MTALASSPAANMRLFQRGGVEALEHQVERLHHVMAEISQHAAERRGDARETRHQHGPQADLADQRAGMQCAAAAEWHGDEARRIVAAFDRDEPDRAGHASFGDANNGGGGRRRRKAQAVAPTRVGDRALAASTSSARQFAAERPRRIDAAKHDLSVGQRRPRIARAVADRARHRARAFRADVQQAAAIDAKRSSRRPRRWW